MNKIEKLVDLTQNMGLRYMTFRSVYELKSKFGLMDRKFPMKPEFKRFTTLDKWRANAPLFFFDSRESIQIPKSPESELAKRFQEITSGTFTFFSNLKYDLGLDYDWITNPDTGFTYDIHLHFSKIQDLSPEAGDIKYVWEKARFSYLYDIVRYDYHFEQDHSEFVFSEIDDFILKNPINQGPNYKCSQEISLRIMNWTFALYFYKNSKGLTNNRFERILNHIYWQLNHVFNNIDFSRIAVRNNHAITETLMLFLSNKLFPFIPETASWSEKGKKWFEEEVDYQIYDDGTYLQYSMNYHRVVVQLLTWGIRLSELHQDKLDKKVYDKARKSLFFLDSYLNEQNGFLPNYGSNDGALFFRLTDDDYRDYRSQLDDLRAVIDGTTHYNTSSYQWYGVRAAPVQRSNLAQLQTFGQGGYALINDGSTKSMIRCGAYKDRPAQADNLHLDIWIDGLNVIWDSGTYKYNTSQDYLNYFMGTEGHNTIQVNGQDQMLKGGRFIWYNWIKKARLSLEENDDSFLFTGEYEGFRNLGKGVAHSRSVAKKKGHYRWTIVDRVNNISDPQLKLYWHLNPEFADKVNIIVKDGSGKRIEPMKESKWMSGYYGSKEESLRYSYEARGVEIQTEIEVRL